jgi:hypothetical protein
MFTASAIPYCEDHIEPSLGLPPDSTAWKYVPSETKDILHTSDIDCAKSIDTAANDHADEI